MTDAPTASLGWRAAFAATLTMSMGIGAFAIISVSALGPLVVPALGLTRTELGSVGTVTFGIAAVISLLGGRQVDVWGARRVLVWIFVAGGVAAAAMAGARSLPWLWVGAVFVGLSQGLANPVTNKLIADHIPPGRQGLQIGVKQSGVPMAQAVVGFVLPPLAVVVGWRSSILVGVLLALVGLLVVAAVIPPSTPTDRSGTTPSGKAPLDSMVRWLTVYAFAVAASITAMTLYVPLYAFERIGLTPAIAGMATGVIGAAGIAARILWGRVAERLDGPILILRLLAGVACVSVLLILVSEHLGAWVLWPGLLGFGISAMAANSVVMLAVVRGAGRGDIGRATGTVGLGLFLGFMVGPVTFGGLVDGTDSYAVGWLMVASFCVLAFAITLAWQRGPRAR